MKKILNKKLVVWLSIISIIIVFFGISIYFVINKKDKDDGLNEDGISSEEKDVFGVWWWNDKLDSEKYLDFADENKISEVYYCDSSLNESTLEFANLAKERNIKVYLLMVVVLAWKVIPLLMDKENIFCLRPYHLCKYMVFIVHIQGR